MGQQGLCRRSSADQTIELNAVPPRLRVNDGQGPQDVGHRLGLEQVHAGGHQLLQEAEPWVCRDLQGSDSSVHSR